LNTKLKCLILDDELQSLTYLKMLCEQIPELEVIRAYNNAILFLKDIPQLNFDLCILDIEMPDFNGIHIAHMLKGKPVIFTTGFNQYAAEAFDLDAIDYVRKPIKLERLQLAVHKVIVRSAKQTAPKNYIQLNTDKGKTILFPDEVNYICTSEMDSRDKVAQMQNSSKILLKNVSLARLREILPYGQFCQINKKELIALGAVHFFSHDAITTNMILSDGKPVVLYLSETYRKDFIRFVKV
jgi:DNA-binding LytR/AlgR family response regulator